MSRLSLLSRLFIAFVVLSLVLPVLALADVPTRPTPQLVLSQAQLWVLVIGVLSPIVAYILNNAVLKKIWASLPEPIAATIHVAVAAVAAAIYSAANTNSFGWNATTLQLLLTSVAAAFVAHGMVWKPSGVQAKLTGG